MLGPDAIDELGTMETLFSETLSFIWTWQQFVIFSTFLNIFCDVTIETTKTKFDELLRQWNKCIRNTQYDVRLGSDVVLLSICFGLFETVTWTEVTLAPELTEACVCVECWSESLPWMATLKMRWKVRMGRRASFKPGDPVISSGGEGVYLPGAGRTGLAFY